MRSQWSIFSPATIKHQSNVSCVPWNQQKNQQVPHPAESSGGRRVFKPAQVTLHRHLVPWFTIRTHTRSPHTSRCVCFPSACVTVCVLSIFVWRCSIFVWVQACVYFYVFQHVCAWMCESLKWLCMFFFFFIYIYQCVCVGVRACARTCVWSVNWTELRPDGLYRSGYLFIEQHLSNLSITPRERDGEFQEVWGGRW